MLKRYIRRKLRPYLQPWETLQVAGVTVSYKRCLDGGGAVFGQEYIPFLKNAEMPRVRRAFEWCAGPAFIGFSLLANDLCETLCLADINPMSVKACKRTIAANGFGDRVSVYQGDSLAAVPLGERWDLVVSNPPHFAELYTSSIIAHDPGWRIHEGFYKGVKRHLSPSGVVLIQENNRGSTAETFRRQIEAGGLKLVYSSPHVRNAPSADNHYYFVASIHAEDPVPDWLARLAAAEAGRG